MLYLLAVVLSVIVSLYSLVSEITAGNIEHLQNGREPNASATIFPIIPIYQLMTVGGTWFLEQITPQYTLWVLLSIFLLLSVAFAISFARLNAKLAKANQKRGGGDGTTTT